MSAEPRRRPKDRKRQIVLQACELFVELGYPNVTMTALAERVGITAGALYRHFATKNDLLDAVLRESFAGFDRTITGTALEPAVDEAIDLVTPHPHIADLWDREVRYAEPGLRRKYGDLMRTWAAEFGRVLRAHRGDLDEGNEELLVWAMQSALACLGTSTIHAPAPQRRVAVRAALLAIASAPLSATGSSQYARGSGRTPVSRRERLLLAAASQFATQGYQETSMAAIGAAADVTGPNLYGYFKSKAELLRAVYERGTHYLWIGLDAAFARAGTPEEALRLVLRSYVEHSREWGSLEVGRSGERAVEAETLGAQREYAAEWIVLVQKIAPDLEPPAARLRVQIGLKVVNDLLRTPHVARYASANDNLAAVGYAILTAT